MDQFPSGYTGMGNDPANLVDPTGMKAGNPGGPSGAGSFTASASGMSLKEFERMSDIMNWDENTPLPSGWDGVVREYLYAQGGARWGGHFNVLDGYRYSPKKNEWGRWRDGSRLGNEPITNSMGTFTETNPMMVSTWERLQSDNGLSGWEKANIISGATGVVPSTINMGITIIQRSANYTDDIAKVARVSSRAGKLLGWAGIGMTIVDGRASGWKNHHTADLLIGGAQTLLLGAGPIGWGVGSAWVAADLITIGVTGTSITENLFD